MLAVRSAAGGLLSFLHLTHLLSVVLLHLLSLLLVALFHLLGSSGGGILFGQLPVLLVLAGL